MIDSTRHRGSRAGTAASAGGLGATQVLEGALRGLSDGLMRLALLPNSTLPARLMEEGLAALREIVPFDAAWWGECSGVMAGIAPQSWVNGHINLSNSFTREWNQLGVPDQFALESISQLDKVIRMSGHDDPEPAVEAFSRRYGLYHAMAVTRVLEGSGLLHFVSLYRRESSPAFNDLQRLLFDLYTNHLMQRWTASIGQCLGGRKHIGDAHALVYSHDRLVYLGVRLGRLLHEQFPGWDGAALPPLLAMQLRQASTQIVVGRRKLSVELQGDLTLISLESRRRSHALPPREFTVAKLYAEGQTHKQIAKNTGLSPATVRTYLRAAYSRLGVSNKVALGQALARYGLRRRLA